MGAQTRQLNETSLEPAAPFLRKMARFRPLSRESRAIVSELSGGETFGAGHTLRGISGGRRPLIVAEGWAGRYRLLSDGRRQITGLMIAGDQLGFDPLSDREAETPMMTMTRVSFLNAAPLKALAFEAVHANLRESMLDAERRTHARLVDSLVRMGRQNGFERAAHFICELEDRLSAAGLSEGSSFPMPLTQEVLADLLGMSIVHINRTFQQLRSERLIELRNGVVTLLKPTLLAGIGDYERAERRPEAA